MVGFFKELGGYLCNADEKVRLRKVMGRTAPTSAAMWLVSLSKIAQLANIGAVPGVTF
jgi:hypothetical protein